MASLSSIYVSAAHLRRMLEMCDGGNRKGIEITISINDDGNAYGKNVDAFIAQTKEQRVNKEKKDYVGSGNCFWTDGNITQLTYSPDGTPKSEPKKYRGALQPLPVSNASSDVPSATLVSNDEDLPF